MKLGVNERLRGKKLYRECWKPVITDEEDYTGLYEVSNLGRVRSVKNNKILKSSKGKNGYLSVSLYKNSKGKTYQVHRLVAFAFIPNPENKPYIDHINTIKTKNEVWNLRWVTPSENSNNPLTREKLEGENHHMFGKHHTEETKKKISETQKGENNPMYGKHHNEEAKSKISKANKGRKCSEEHKKKLKEAGSKKVICIEMGIVFDSMTEASEVLNVSRCNISGCCTGKRKTAGGFHWKYYEEEVS